MQEQSTYIGRPGQLSCSAEKAFTFISDLRNLGRFAKEGTVSDWQAEKDTCSFAVSMMGRVHIRIREKEDNTRIVYEGDALNKKDFTTEISLAGMPDETAQARLTLKADLNPMMKMIADKPIRQFIEILMQEMEKFRDWNDAAR